MCKYFLQSESIKIFFTLLYEKSCIFNLKQILLQAIEFRRLRLDSEKFLLQKFFSEKSNKRDCSKIEIDQIDHFIDILCTLQ
jgi:hypothetical protein